MSVSAEYLEYDDTVYSLLCGDYGSKTGLSITYSSAKQEVIDHITQRAQYIGLVVKTQKKTDGKVTFTLSGNANSLVRILEYMQGMRNAFAINLEVTKKESSKKPEETLPSFKDMIKQR